MNGTFRFGDLVPLHYFAAVALLAGCTIGLVMTTDGPFDLARSIVVWVIHSCAAIALTIAAHLGMGRIPTFEKVSPWARLTLSGIAGAALFAPIALGIDLLWAGDRVEPAPGAIALELLDEYSAIVLPLTLVWVGINAPFVLGYRAVRDTRAEERTEQQEVTQEKRVAPPFMKLVDPNVQGEILYLKAELHYIQVVTDKGRDLILYSLRDAATELGSCGIQTHRSWWVNTSVIARFDRRGREGLLTLIDGTQVPVSRNRLKSLTDLLTQRQERA